MFTQTATMVATVSYASAVKLKMFAWDNEDVYQHNAGVLCDLARSQSGQIKTL